MTSPTEFAPGLTLQGLTAPPNLKDFKLVAFDMDSTLVSIECVDGDSDEARVFRPLQAAACPYRIAFVRPACRPEGPDGAGRHAQADEV